MSGNRFYIERRRIRQETYEPSVHFSVLYFFARQPNEDLDETILFTIGLRTVLKSFSLSTVLGRNTTSVATTIVEISGEKNATLGCDDFNPIETVFSVTDSNRSDILSLFLFEQPNNDDERKNNDNDNDDTFYDHADNEEEKHGDIHGRFS